MATTHTLEPGLAGLVNGIVNDAQVLIKQEIALARREITDELNKTKQAAVSLGIGIATALAGVWLLVMFVVYLLHEEAHLKLWQSYGIAGVVLALIGMGLVFLAKARAREIHLVPRQTVETMRENVDWIRSQA